MAASPSRSPTSASASGERRAQREGRVLIGRNPLAGAGQIGDRLIGEAREIWHEGRNGLYDVTIKNEHTGTVVAIVHGRMRFVGGRVLDI